MPPENSSRVALAGRALLDPLQGVWDVNDALNVNAGGDDVVAVDLARLDQMLNLGHRELSCGRHHRIEMSGGLPVDKIALRIALPGMHQRDVGDEPGLHHVRLVVEVADFLALRDDRAHARAGEEGWNSGPSGADALGQGALRVEFKFKFAR